MASTIICYSYIGEGMTLNFRQMTINNEDQLQAACVRWFSDNYPQYRKMLFAIPNGGTRIKQEAAKFRATGVVAGVADLCLVMSKGRVTWLEAKFGSGTQSEEQIKWQEKVQDLGHLYMVFYTLEEFKTIICNLIGK